MVDAVAHACLRGERGYVRKVVRAEEAIEKGVVAQIALNETNIGACKSCPSRAL